VNCLWRTEHDDSCCIYVFINYQKWVKGRGNGCEGIVWLRRYFKTSHSFAHNTDS